MIEGMTPETAAQILEDKGMQMSKISLYQNAIHLLEDTFEP